MNEIEFLKDEFRNGTAVKNGASEYIGGYFESLAVFGVATVDFGLGFTPLRLSQMKWRENPGGK